MITSECERSCRVHTTSLLGQHILHFQREVQTIGWLLSGVMPPQFETRWVRSQAPRDSSGAPGVSLSQKIDTCCRRMALPRQLRGRAEFEFLL